VDFGALQGEKIVQDFCNKNDGLFSVDFKFRGFVDEDFGVGKLGGGGVIMYVGAIGVSSVMSVSLNLGHLRDQAA
jgi:hypothetical protein